MRNLHRCLIFTALSIYLLIGGTTGVCKILGILELEHHHHSHAQLAESSGSDGTHSSICVAVDGAPDCDIPAIPCDESHKEDGGELNALTPVTTKSIASPFVGLLPAIVMIPQQSPTTQGAGCYAFGRTYSTRRGSPPSLAAQLCRFLV